MARACALAALTALVTAGTAVAQPAPATSLPPDPQPRDLVLAYYYPWYIKGDWSRHGYVDTPVLGKYGTDDPAVAQQHITWAAQAGIDAFVASWWGPDHLAEKHMHAGLLKANNLGDIRFCLIYESLGRLDALDGKEDSLIDFASDKVVEGWRNDFAYLRDHYFKHASYLKVGERPVVVLYVTRTFRRFRRDHITDMEKALGIDVYLVADEAFLGEQADPTTARHGLKRDGESVFDAYTAYNMFENALVREGETAGQYMQREAMPIYESWSKSTVFCPGVMPTYHDFRGNKPLIGTPQQFADMIRAARKLPGKNVGDGVRRMIFITSFNEWWEGTTIEPAWEYGTGLLDAINTAVQGGEGGR